MIVNPRPVETADDLPLFCTVCGRHLVRVSRRVGYSPRTGHARWTAVAYCRGSLLRRLLTHEPHDAYVVASRPPAPPPPPPLGQQPLEAPR